MSCPDRVDIQPSDRGPVQFNDTERGGRETAPIVSSLKLELLAQEGLALHRAKRKLGNRLRCTRLRKQPVDERLVAGLFGAQASLSARRAARGRRARRAETRRHTG